MKTVAILQARLDSTRLPNKVLLKIGKKSIIEIISEKLKKSKELNNYVFCIPNDKNNTFLKFYLKKRKLKFFLGSKENVLERYYKTAKKFSADIIVRLTCDNPLLDVELMDKMISIFKRNKLDFLDNTSPSTFPDGLDIEIFNKKTLYSAKKKAQRSDDLEHVTLFMKRQKIKKQNYFSTHNFSDLRFTIDNLKDYENICNAYKQIKSDALNWKKLINYLNKNQKIKKNFFDKRNHGMLLNKGQKLWLRAKALIGGGNSMISKNPELYPSQDWPVYFSKTKGCAVWDLEGKKYLDFATMGVGTNILGYNNKSVDNQVIRSIKDGNISSLNCKEEVELADELLQINKWGDKVCFARTGGEANAIAIRLARLQSEKRTKVLACGYHGWHDWYLASKNSDEKNIRNQHLPFYSNKGIPSKLKGTIEFFSYNNFKEFLAKIKSDKKIGIVKMETMRFEFPKKNFLKKIQKIVNQYNLILIIDECTTGFRENFGGLYSKYKLKPDIVVYGKALGNGYAITAIVGNKRVMKNFDKSFISSTFWSERIGFVAGLSALKVMKKEKSWKKIIDIGKYIQSKWKFLAKKNNLKIKINGIPSLTNFNFKSEHNKIYISLITHEMLKKNILATNTIYVSIAHTKKLLKKYFKTLEKVFQIIKEERIEDIKKRIGYKEYKQFRLTK